jgi:hypothetical protein
MIPAADHLKMQTYTVEVLTNPPCYMIALGLAKVERKTMQIQGYTLKDAKKRAGIA